MKSQVLQWRRSAACAQAADDEREKFFPVGRPSTAPQRAFCARCPVREECLEFALESPWRPEAIVAGLTPRELDPLWRERHPERTELRAEYSWLGLR